MVLPVDSCALRQPIPQKRDITFLHIDESKTIPQMNERAALYGSLCPFVLRRLHWVAGGRIGLSCRRERKGKDHPQRFWLS